MVYGTVLYQLDMMSIIALVLWELFAFAVAMTLKGVIEEGVPEVDKVFVAMCMGALVAAFAILPFTPIF